MLEPEGGVLLSDTSRECEVVLRLARRAAYFGLRPTNDEEVKKETLFLLCSIANRHSTLELLASTSLKLNWTWFKSKYDFEAWLCAGWVGWAEGKAEMEVYLGSRMLLPFDITLAAVIPSKQCSYNELANVFVNGTLQSEVLSELGHNPYQKPHEWWHALEVVLTSRFPLPPNELPLEFKRTGALTLKSTNRAYFLTHVVLLICRYGRADVGKPVQLRRSTISLLIATLNYYCCQTGMHAGQNDEVMWELCSALQCLGVESLLVKEEQRTITSRFESLEVEPDSLLLSSEYQEMHFHFLAAVLAAGPSRVVES